MGRKKSVPSDFIRVIDVIRDYSSSMKHEELTGDIIGAAMAVLNELKPGLEACGEREQGRRLTTDFTDSFLTFPSVASVPSVVNFFWVAAWLRWVFRG